MAWTYSGNPANTPRDAVRFLVGDTKADTPLSTDEEIAWALTQNDNVYGAAAIVAQAVSVYFATLAESTEIGPIKITYGRRAEFYAKRAKEFEYKASTSQSFVVYAGGTSDNLDNDPNFTIGMNDITSLDTTSENS